MTMKVYIRGAGDLASGIAYRLKKVGIQVFMADLAQPLVVRRTVAFAQAIYSGIWLVEEISAIKVNSMDEALLALENGQIPVFVDPELDQLTNIKPDVLIDARMLKNKVDYDLTLVDMIIGLGPGFEAGINCQAVIETNRGHFLGRVYWEGKAEKNTGVPGSVMGIEGERVIRAQSEGIFSPKVRIGDTVEKGQVIGSVDNREIVANISGMVRGLIHEGVRVHSQMKVGDIDPRKDPRYIETISDKSLSIGGGVLEAIFTVKRPGNG